MKEKVQMGARTIKKDVRPKLFQIIGTLASEVENAWENDQSLG